MDCMDGIAAITGGRSRRVSSWDRTGGNDDCIRIDPGETRVLADIRGPGVITHIYMTTIFPNPLDYRDAVIRMYWDGEETPSVEVPLGDFFCVSNSRVRHFQSLAMAVNPGAAPKADGSGGLYSPGLNCYFPMPFARGARIEVSQEGPNIFGGTLGRLWYHIDYEEHDAPPPDALGRFHAQWRRECLTRDAQAAVNPSRGAFPKVNPSDAENYVLLEAQGQGHVAGLLLQVDNVQGGWYGEGDDMVVIDGEGWPPSIHGTGSEEVFGGGACPNREYAGPYTGFLTVENLDGEEFKGKNAMYRWYLRDPIRFRESIRMSIEHGHANDFENDYASVVYWYQHEPHAAFPALPSRRDRRPLFPEAFYRACDTYGELCRVIVRDYSEPFVFENRTPPDWLGGVQRKLHEAYSRLHSGPCDEADRLFDEAVALLERHRA